MKMTVNELLVLMKTVRTRKRDLEVLGNQVAVKTTYGWGTDDTRVVEPQYDIKVVDKKVVELEKFLYQADSKIKTSNALTKIEIEADIDSLLAPLE